MTKDALGAIFRAEKRLGRGDLFELISHFQDGSHTATVYQHEFYDGMGALLKESQKWSGATIEVPTFNLKSPKSLSELLKGIKGFKEDLSPSVTHWKNMDKNATYTPKYFAWRVFSPAETQSLVSAARAQKISLNSLLLWATNTVIAQDLLAENQLDCRWLTPVNMRRSHDERNSHSNHTSSVGLRFTRDSSAAQIDAQYRAALNAWRAKTTHALARGVSALGEDILYNLARRRGEKNSWIGSFTNLGVWNFPSVKNTDHWPIALSVAPPAGTPCFPVGIGLITWQGHLSIGLRLHAGLVGQEDDMPEKLLNRLTDFLSGVINSQLRPVRMSRSESIQP